MALEMLVGLDVTDSKEYANYRAAMLPLLEAVGGRFGYDFEIARTLRSEAAHPINRVFTIRFPDAAARDAFFADPRYLQAKRDHFEPSVAGVTIIAEYER